MTETKYKTHLFVMHNRERVLRITRTLVNTSNGETITEDQFDIPMGLIDFLKEHENSYADLSTLTVP